MKFILNLYRKVRAILSDWKYALLNIGRFKISEPAQLHHIGLNVVDTESSLAFYEKYFGTKRVKYNNDNDAMDADKLLLLLNLVENPPTTNQGTSLWHIGWSGEDAQREMDWRVKEGIEVHTPVTALDEDHFMYFWGPNKEMIEVYTRKKGHAFEHIHLLATDVDVTMRWFSSTLGLDPVYRKSAKSPRGFKWNYFTVNDIDIVVFGKPDKKETWWPEEGFKPTDGSAFNHIGFCFQNVEAIFKEMKTAGICIVEDIKYNPENELKSFLIRGPDQLLIRILGEI
ncbi:VOC family protein [Maribacter luteus]|uniref:VOC family protein n=1 Tax=Maribacter luteus TaxID=2594478 RepID=UPI002491CC73|nr:VOC family protein [Maribacter luteus]